jgi:hypothetical protein
VTLVDKSALLFAALALAEVVVAAAAVYIPSQAALVPDSVLEKGNRVSSAAATVAAPTGAVETRGAAAE